jgi:hypothetical protein
MSHEDNQGVSRSLAPSFFGWLQQGCNNGLFSSLILALFSSQTARHTFPDLARQGDADLNKISKALGHSSLIITERYIKGFDQDAVDEVVNIVTAGIAAKKENVKKQQPMKPAKSKVNPH